MFGVDDLIMGGVSAGASMFNTHSNNSAAMDRQREAQAFNAQMAQQQMDFQERMSSSAYQRASADMKAAGLNPILAAGANSSTPGGAMATTTPASVTGSGIGDAVSKGIATAQQNKQLNQAVALQKQLEENAKYTADNIQADTASKMATTTNTQANTQATEERTKVTKEVLHSAIADAAKSKSDTEFYNSPAGKILRLLGTGGKELSNIVNPIGSLVGSARQAVGVMKDKANYDDFYSSVGR